MIEKIIYQRQRPDKIGERQKYRDRCILNIEAIFNIFFPVALSSLIGMRDNIPVTYTTSEPLPDCPEIPDEQGKDILLAGILTEAEPHWYQCLATLLCAATFAGKARDASFFMRQWAEIILQENTVEHEQLEAIYLQFVVHVGTMINEWENDLTRMRLGPLPAYRTFRHTITLWPDKRHPRPIDSFVQKVLQALDARICLHAHMKGD